jgi:sec-independent protein translocase protein TatB
MFDFGFGELLLLAVIALVVLGPERLPVAARLAGLWIRKARAQWNSVKAELENELADEDLRRNLREASAAMRSGAQQVNGLRDEMASSATRMSAIIVPSSVDVAPSSPGADALPASTVQPAPIGAGAAASSSGTDRVDSDPAQLSLLVPDPDPDPSRPASAAERMRADG